MMDADILKAPTEDGLKAAREAIRIQEEISRLEAELEKAKTIRNEYLAEAIRGNVRNLDGWSFIPVAPKKEASFAAFLDFNADLADAYTEWYRDTLEVKVTATSLQKFAKAQGWGADQTDVLLGAVLRDTGGEATVQLRAPKGAKE